MLSSTSNSDQRLPALPWETLLGGAGAAFALFVGMMELGLALRGFQATVVDSEALWLEQRTRAADLGERALIVVGSSRAQLDVDLDVLRRRTGLEPVQLAVDGSSFRPVLAGLAADPDVRGTIMVDVSDQVLARDPGDDDARRWQAAYERARARAASYDFAWSERRLQQALRATLRSYADGAQPLTSLRLRLVAPAPVSQYLVTRADRSRSADYGKVDMPGFYYARVARNLGQPAPLAEAETWDDVDRWLRARIAAITPSAADRQAYEHASRTVAAQARAIRDRGGHVVFFMLPKSGLVRALDDRRYPRAEFWDRFASLVDAPAIHFDDVDAWRGLQCPDGSHLDYRQRAAFSDALATLLSESVAARSSGARPAAR